MSSLVRQVRWLILTRVVVVTSVLVPLLLYQLWLRQRPPETPPETGPSVVVPPQAPPEEQPTLQGPPLLPGAEPRIEPPLQPPLQPLIATTEASALPQLDLFFILGIAVTVYVASGVYDFLLRRFPHRARSQVLFQLLVDLSLVTLIVWKLGVGVSNPFSLFYLLFIAVASFLLGRQAGFSVAILAYLLYAGLVIGLSYGKIEPAMGTMRPSRESFLLAYNLSIHLFAFVAIALLTAALARRLERAQQELEVEREDLARLQVVHRDVIESIQSGLVTTDLDGRITSINRAGTEILARSEAELLGTDIVDTELFDPESWHHFAATASEQGGRHRAEVEIERDGSTVYIGFSISMLHDGGGRQRGYILIFQDFTRWRELEDQVRIKDRMAAVGELAAGIAHEIGNPLAAISGSVQMLVESLEERPGEHRLLDILLKESQRLDRTIKGFLRFARPKDRSTVPFDVARLLAENCDLLRNSPELGEHHRLEVDLDPPSVRIHADPDQISQIFWNLVRNALRAMENGGTLRVAGRPEGDRYVLEVSDTGHGMSDDERANLFHPFQSFFDTGTGIGMAIVYRIVEEHRGHVSVSSRPGGGTVLTVELPRDGSRRADDGDRSQTDAVIEEALES
jgi:two-component system sensor histidine kinase PilS (NtrC family)